MNPIRRVTDRWPLKLACLLSVLLFAAAIVSLLPGRVCLRMWRTSDRADFLLLARGGVYWVAQGVEVPDDAWWTTDLSQYGSIHVRADGKDVAGLMSSGLVPPRGLLGFCRFSTPGGRMYFGSFPGRTGECRFSDCGVGIPFWAAAGISAIAPGIWLRDHRRRRRLRARADGGLCFHCGYDLRASSGRCPECGSDHELVPGAV